MSTPRPATTAGNCPPPASVWGSLPPSLVSSQLRQPGSGSPDPGCLSWELTKLGGKDPQTEAGGGQFPAVVAGLGVDIGYNPTSHNVQAYSRYIVPLLRLETLHD